MVEKSLPTMKYYLTTGSLDLNGLLISNNQTHMHLQITLILFELRSIAEVFMMGYLKLVEVKFVGAQ